METLGNSFQINQSYFFLDTLDYIENYPSNLMNVGEKKQKQDRKEKDSPIYLGKFLGFKGGVIMGCDWFDRAKATFENGTISCGYFKKVSKACD